MAAARTYSIGELAAAASVSRRTVRFYVQRGLLEPPFGLGRGARYAEAHLARLQEIRTGHERGVPLHDLRGRTSTPPSPPTRRAPRARPAPPVEPEPEPEKCDTWWAAWDESTAAESAAALRYVPGQTWLRQPLFMGYELHVPVNRTPLSTWQLNELIQRLAELLEAGKRQ